MVTKRSETKAGSDRDKPVAEPAIIWPEGLQDSVEFMLLLEIQFFLHTALVADADSVLASLGYGRAHHRALGFTARQPGISPAALADVQHISSQALAKTMSRLLADGLLRQDSDPSDRRVRRYSATPKGLALLKRVSQAQHQRMRTALKSLGRSDMEAHIRFCKAMLAREDRDRLSPH
jgi:DNA-binding MarR family transcriptional regulator